MAEQWTSYSASLRLSEVSDTLRDELQFSFYMGAHGLLMWIHENGPQLENLDQVKAFAGVMKNAASLHRPSGDILVETFSAGGHALVFAMWEMAALGANPELVKKLNAEVDAQLDLDDDEARELESALQRLRPELRHTGGDGAEGAT